MNRSLGSISVFFIGLAVVFFVLAAMAPHGRLWGAEPAPSPPGSNQWSWDGGDRLEIDVPATVKLSPGGPPSVSVHGDQDDVKDIRLSHGKLTGRDDDCFLGFLCDDDRRGRAIQVDVKGVTLRDIRINGVAKLDLGHVEQDNLKLRISGAAEVEGEGHVNDLDLSISGAGNVEFAKLAVANATLNLSGAGRAAIAPSDEADINISGVGQVELATKPKTLHSHISGMGNIGGPGADGRSGQDIDWGGDHRRHDHGDAATQQIRYQDGDESAIISRTVQRAVKKALDDSHMQENVRRSVYQALDDADVPPAPPAPPSPDH